jgi:hypothetical protein
MWTLSRTDVTFTWKLSRTDVTFMWTLSRTDFPHSCERCHEQISHIHVNVVTNRFLTLMWLETKSVAALHRPVPLSNRELKLVTVKYKKVCTRELRSVSLWLQDNATPLRTDSDVSLPSVPRCSTSLKLPLNVATKCTVWQSARELHKWSRRVPVLRSEALAFRSRHSSDFLGFSWS